MKVKFIWLLIVASGCMFISNKKILLESKLPDGSNIKIVAYESMPSSENIIWIIRKTAKESCYITGRIFASHINKRVSIVKSYNDSFIVRIEDTLKLKGLYGDYAISMNDTFCFNDNCEKYPTDCD